MQGHSSADFTELAETFSHQLRRTTGGASLAVYHRGELVVDLWGGLRTNEGDPWQSDTLAMCFSTTKGIASAALHLQADAGLVDYDVIAQDDIVEDEPLFAAFEDEANEAL